MNITNQIEFKIWLPKLSLYRTFTAGPLFHTETKSQRHTALTSVEITPRHRHCLRGLDGTYGRLDEIVRDILNGKLNLTSRRRRLVPKTMMTMKKQILSEEPGDHIYDTWAMNGMHRLNNPGRQSLPDSHRR